MSKQTLVRITTVPLSLEKLLTGQLHFMSSFYNVIAISSDSKRLDKYGEQEKVAVFSLEMTRQITPIKDVLAVLKLYFFLKKTKPFIVHTHTPKAGIVGMLASKLAGVPNRLHTVAGMPLLEQVGLKRKILDFVEKLTYSCATKVYPNSFKMKDIIIENEYCTSSKLKVLGNGSSNGIDTSYFNTSHFSEQDKDNLKLELGILPTDFVFVFVGRIVADKGINELIAAFKDIQKLRKEVKLLLVGPFEQELDPLNEETLNQITSNKSIISVGYQLDVRPYFAIANSLVFPSYREGFPNVVMQAGAMGLPCIVTDINGCNEIIEDKKNGCIIPVKNQKAIFELMINFIDDKQHFFEMQQNARAMIVSRFDQQLMWDTILQEYRSFDAKIIR
ncbi:MAG: glycosyltransferase family 4 protein [Flavobacterium sp.]|nr:glycosyltransferase family 4 protein [Flavobacterium sp.]